MTLHQQVLAAFKAAVETVTELASSTEIERTEKITVADMPRANIIPGSITEEEFSGSQDAEKERFEVKIELYVAGESPSSMFFPLIRDINAALRRSETLLSLIAGFGLRMADEPVYGDYGGFAGYVTLRYPVALLVET